MAIEEQSELRRLFEEHSERLTAYAMGFVGDRDAAEDVVQDAFVYLWSHRGRATKYSSMGAYLFATVRHACLNIKIRRRVEQRYRDAVVSQLDDDVREPSDDEMEHLHRRAMAFVESLPERCRQIFVLGVLDGAGYADIARRLGVSINTVKTQMQRARKRMRALGDMKILFIFAV